MHSKVKGMWLMLPDAHSVEVLKETGGGGEGEEEGEGEEGGEEGAGHQPVKSRGCSGPCLGEPWLPLQLITVGSGLTTISSALNQKLNDNRAGVCKSGKCPCGGDPSLLRMQDGEGQDADPREGQVRLLVTSTEG